MVLPNSAREHLEQARQTARDSLTEARRMVWALRPDLLERAGSLDEALQRLAARGSADATLRVTATTRGDPTTLPAAHEVALLRVAQEALSNVRQHAGAHAVTLRLLLRRQRLLAGRRLATLAPTAVVPTIGIHVSLLSILPGHG